jgi:hypothetical protein
MALTMLAKANHLNLHHWESARGVGVEMTMKQFYILLVLVAGCFGLVACEEDPVSAPVGASGEIVGFVTLRDVNGVRRTDMSGVRVTLRGTTFSALTDTNGKWRMTSVPAGIYDLDMSKPAFATNHLRAFQFVGGGTAYLPSVIDLVESRQDTFMLEKLSFLSDYQYYRKDTLVETDTGWMQPLDSTEIPNRFIALEGMASFEIDTQTSAVVYLRPYYTDLTIVPSTNYAVGVITKGHSTFKLSVQYPLQYGYPRGVPVELVLTTRQNNTYYFEPDTRKRIVTDPHDLLRVMVTLPME